MVIQRANSSGSNDENHQHILFSQTIVGNKSSLMLIALCGHGNWILRLGSEICVFVNIAVNKSISLEFWSGIWLLMFFKLWCICSLSLILQSSALKYSTIHYESYNSVRQMVWMNEYIYINVNFVFNRWVIIHPLWGIWYSLLFCLDKKLPTTYLWSTGW